jgi:hypothetical protein
MTQERVAELFSLTTVFRPWKDAPRELDFSPKTRLVWTKVRKVLSFLPHGIKMPC